MNGPSASTFGGALADLSGSRLPFREEESAVVLEPYPGLRPFTSEDSAVFFGREGLTDTLMSKIAGRHFLAVVGTSGSGKSSLVRAGFLPSIESGYLKGAGSSWSLADFRPGGRPIARFADALNKSGFFHHPIDESALRSDSYAVQRLLEGRRSDPKGSLLILVDQFEELFRYQSREDSWGEDEPRAFVRLLLQTIADRKYPVYLVITLRSDFLGDCARFRDLPETVSDAQFLIPRMTREQRKLAIEGPARVAGATISNRLVQKLLNDGGDEPDQLPVLQHALMRTWTHWRANVGDEPSKRPIDIADYEAVGGTEDALSEHAEEVLREAKRKVTGADPIVRRVFQRLWDRDDQKREVRRQRTLRELSEVAEATEADVLKCLEPFRDRGASFLVPPSTQGIGADEFVDVTHECLLRLWKRLAAEWIPEERASAKTYLRLVDRAEEKSPMTDPALQDTLQWWADRNPNAPWAQRYTRFDFRLAKAYLRDSEAYRDRTRAKRTLSRVATPAFALLWILGWVGWFLELRAQALLTEINTQKNLAEAARAGAVRQALTAGAAAENSDASNADRAALLAATALRLGASVDASNAISRALSVLPLAVTTLPYDPRGSRVRLDQSGDRLLMISPRAIRSCSLHGDIAEPLRCRDVEYTQSPGAVRATAVSANGALLAVAKEDEALLVDPNTGAVLYRRECSAQTVTVDATGNTAAVTCYSDTVDAPPIGTLLLRAPDGGYREQSDARRRSPLLGWGWQVGWSEARLGRATRRTDSLGDNSFFYISKDKDGKENEPIALGGGPLTWGASGDLDSVAWIQADNKIHFQTTADANNKILTPAGHVENFALSTNGALLVAVSSTGIVQMWDTDSGVERMRANLRWSGGDRPATEAGELSDYDLDFDDIHGRIALSDGRGRVTLIQAAMGQWLDLNPRQFGMSDEIAGLVSGQWTAVSSSAGRVDLRPLMPTSPDLFARAHSAWSPDLQTWVSATAYSQNVSVFRTEGDTFHVVEKCAGSKKSAEAALSTLMSEWGGMAYRQKQESFLSEHGDLAIFVTSRSHEWVLGSHKVTDESPQISLLRLSVPTGAHECAATSQTFIEHVPMVTFASESNTLWVGQSVATGRLSGGGAILRIDARESEMRWEDSGMAYGGTLHALAVTPDGARLAVVDDPVPRAYSEESATLADPDAEETPQSAVEDSWYRVTIWEPGCAGCSARQVAEFRVPPPSRTIALSSDGRYAATADSSIIRVWDVDAPTQERELARLSTSWPVDRLAFSADDGRLLVGGPNSRADSLLWRAPDLIADACRRAGRDLKAEELAPYAPAETMRPLCFPGP